MRFLLLATVAGMASTLTTSLEAEPLYLRIRPNSEDIGSAGTSFDREAAVRAMELREEVWKRAERRARIAIASVCSGCLRQPPSASRPLEKTGIAGADAPKIDASEPSDPSSAQNTLLAANR